LSESFSYRRLDRVDIIEQPYDAKVGCHRAGEQLCVVNLTAERLCILEFFLAACRRY